MVASAFAADTKTFDAQSFAAAQKAGEPILVAIHASWCPTCKAQKPVLSELTAEPKFKSVVYFIVDFDNQKDAVKYFGARVQSTLQASITCAPRRSMAAFSVAPTGRQSASRRQARIEMIPGLSASRPNHALRTILARVVEGGGMKEHEIRKAGRGLVERAAAALAEAAFDRVAAVCLKRVMRRLPLQRYRYSWQRELGRMAGAGDLLALRAAANDREGRR